MGCTRNATFRNVSKNLADHVRQQGWIKPLTSNNPVFVDREQVDRIPVVVGIDLPSVGTLQIDPAPLFDKDLMSKSKILLKLILIELFIITGDNVDLGHRMRFLPTRAGEFRGSD